MRKLFVLLLVVLTVATPLLAVSRLIIVNGKIITLGNRVIQIPPPVDTIAYDSGGGVVATITGDIPANWLKDNLVVRRVEIGTSCTLIGSSVLRGCTNLRSIEFHGNDITAIGAFFCGKNKNFGAGTSGDVIFPDSVAIYGNEVFDSISGGGVNPNIKYVYVGTSCIAIGTDFFGGVTGITNLTINTLDPPTAGANFVRLNETVIIHVPVNSSFAATYGGKTVVKDLPALPLP